MARRLDEEDVVLRQRPLSLLLGLVLLLFAPFVNAQKNLGELLDAGAKPLSAEEFRQELVQRMIVGPTPTGGSIEMVYTPNGLVEGTGGAAPAGIGLIRLRGEWTVDPKGRICTSMTTGGPGTSSGPVGVMLPPRCQSWFKLAEKYFLSDSETDRSAKVLPRTVKQ